MKKNLIKLLGALLVIIVCFCGCTKANRVLEAEVHAEESSTAELRSSIDGDEFSMSIISNRRAADNQPEDNSLSILDCIMKCAT